MTEKEQHPIEQNKSNKYNKFRIISLIVSVAVLITVITILVFQHYQRQQHQQQSNELSDSVRQVIEEAESETIPDSGDLDSIDESEPVEEAPQVIIPIDFEYLWEINESVHAWITIYDTDIDYPILQYGGSDQEFYLRRNIDREWMMRGSLFTQNFNAQDFSDRVTLIYGHNMRDGTKFGRLYQYLNADFMREHRNITIYTPNSILTYKVFGAFTFDDRHIMVYYDFEFDSHFYWFLQDLTEFRTLNQFWLDDIVITKDDRIVILSTCVQRRDHRLLIGAVLIDEEIKK
ncbi:MAG: class B sortase [Oscillospiraceae bacterium]|nr:class B sortase [Oscillospiraceae bacterium]